MMRSFTRFQEISTELLASGHSMRFRAEGQSMHPTIRNGETITVESVTPSGVKRGDILLCRAVKNIIAHRVVRIERKPALFSSEQALFTFFFILRGDALYSIDEPVAAEQILGKVVATERNGRIIRLDSRRAKVMCVVVARLRLAVIWFRSLVTVRNRPELGNSVGSSVAQGTDMKLAKRDSF